VSRVRGRKGARGALRREEGAGVVVGVLGVLVRLCPSGPANCEDHAGEEWEPDHESALRTPPVFREEFEGAGGGRESVAHQRAGENFAKPARALWRDAVL
jgi:hypothetical protein